MKPRLKQQELEERKNDSGGGDESTETSSMDQWRDLAPENEERNVPRGHPRRHRERGG